TIPQALSLDVDQRHNIRAEYGDYRTNIDGVFAAGDCRRGQSLVVWAINEGRGVAESVNKFLIEKSEVTEDEAYIGAM
ncbi:glutamate synthase subunit beta, partial [Nannochloropsis oceanica]